MDALTRHHLERLKTATITRHTAASIPEWVIENTHINGANYSFRDHEYQERILRDESSEVYIRKCSQVGLTELSVRLALALCNVIPGYTVAYTLPTASFAATIMRTRIDPIIESSPYLSAAIHKTTDNSDVKRFGDSYLYLKGCQSTNAPISVPCDHLIHDEIDFSSPETISQYQSRLTHSKWKRKTKLSTPTVPKRGIDYEFQRSRRHFNMVKCDHCGHWFIPDYFEHVRLPGYDDDLRKINKHNLIKYDHRKAYVACPSCGKAPDLSPAHREWVAENPDDHYIAAGYQVTPFDAPGFITPGYLIEASTQYKRYIDFINFNLGLPAEDRESTLLAEELKAIIVQMSPGGLGRVMGLDMGMECHCIVADVTWDGQLIDIHSEVIPVGRVRERRKELARQFNVRMTVVDSQPYTETVLAMQQEDINLYGAVYTRSKSIETYTVKDQEADEEKGRSEVRQVNINRDKAFDALMEDIRSGRIYKVSDKNDELWIAQLTDMRRMKEWTADAEMSFVWRKSEDGNDHFHHAQLYARVASQIMGVARGGILLPNMVSSFRIRQN